MVVSRISTMERAVASAGRRDISCVRNESYADLENERRLTLSMTGRALSLTLERMRDGIHSVWLHAPEDALPLIWPTRTQLGLSAVLSAAIDKICSQTHLASP